MAEVRWRRRAEDVEQQLQNALGQLAGLREECRHNAEAHAEEASRANAAVSLQKAQETLAAESARNTQAALEALQQDLANIREALLASRQAEEGAQAPLEIFLRELRLHPVSLAIELQMEPICSEAELKVKVTRGGKLKARKGVNVPDCEIDCAALTEKDIEDAEYLLQLEPPCEYICVSFAQKGQDLQELIDIMQINTSWRINAISDGQRRRCQLLECLADEKDVYILDEITTDLDLYAREGLLRFLREETEQRGATVFYATHIFDHLADWATHVLFFSQARIARCCRMEELHEYHALLANGTRCPLYSLMCDWVFREYDAPVALDALADADKVEPPQGPALQANNLTYSYVPGGRPQLDNVSFSFPHGSRILVVGANGAGKSTLLSILGGKRMIPRGLATVLGKDAFNDPAVSREVMYCGDWRSEEHTV